MTTLKRKAVASLLEPEPWKEGAVPLGVSMGWASSWNLQQALRELVSNVFDALQGSHNELHVPLSESKSLRLSSGWVLQGKLWRLLHHPLDREAVGGFYFGKSASGVSVLALVNRKATLPWGALTVGSSTKQGQRQQIGQFGEGLKIAICACLREGKPFEIHVSGFTFSFVVGAQDSVVANVSEGFADSLVEQVVRSLGQLLPGVDKSKDVIQVVLGLVEFSSLDLFQKATHKELPPLKSNLLKLPPSLRLPSKSLKAGFYHLASPHGAILWPEHPGPDEHDLRCHIYVQGVLFFRFEHQKRHGLDLPAYASSNRNRDGVDEPTYRYYLKKILEHVLPSHPWLANEILEELQSPQPMDCSHLHGLSLGFEKPATEALVHRFRLQ